MAIPAASTRRPNWDQKEIKVLFESRESFASLFEVPKSNPRFKQSIDNAWAKVAAEVNKVGKTKDLRVNVKIGIQNFIITAAPTGHFLRLDRLCSSFDLQL